MKKIIALSLILCAFYFTGLSQTIDGPVLKKELAGKYEGSQKKGLAHGAGTATGTDTYTARRVTFRYILTATYSSHFRRTYTCV